MGPASIRFAGTAPHSAAPVVSAGALPPTTLMTLTIFCPSLSCAPVTVILSPAFKVFAFQPKLNSLCGEAVSAIHFSTLKSEEHTSELQSHLNLVCRLLLEKKK